MPTIDVLLPVRNCVQFLGEAIDSIQRQTFSDWRLLILDHGSSDGSFELSQRYEEEDARIKALSFPDADGLSNLLNAGLEKCDCRYLLRQDADDIAVANRMELVNEVFSGDSKHIVVGGEAILIDPDGREIGHLRPPISSQSVTAASFFNTAVIQPTVAINFSAFKNIGASYGVDFLKAVPASESITVKRYAEDYFLFGQLAIMGLCININAPLIEYRRHPGAVGLLSFTLQIEAALQISRFLAKSVCIMKNVRDFDPRPFCNHAEYVVDFQLKDYTSQFEQMAVALRRSLGRSSELERELMFRRILATRNSGQMAARYLQFRSKYGATPSEWRTVRNWLLRGLRKGKYVYRVKADAPMSEGSNERVNRFE